MMNQKAELEIHIPCFNERKNILPFLQSLQQQSFENFTAVIHDNCSVDGTTEVCEEFCRGDARFALNKIPVNIHVINQLIRIKFSCRSPFVAQLSVNDVISRDFLSDLMIPIKHDENIAVSYSHGFLLDKGSEVDPGFSSRIDTTGMDPVSSAVEVMAKYTHPFSLWAIFRREIFEKCRPMQFVYGGDHIFIAEASLYGAIVPTSSRTNWRTVGERPEWDVVKHNILIQLEEHVRGIHPVSMFYGVAQDLPFLNMIHGHIEMFSHALVSEHHKYRLVNLSLEILSGRFGRFIASEIEGFVQTQSSFVELTEKHRTSFDPLVVQLRLQKLRREVDKIKLYQQKIPVAKELVLELEQRLISFP